MTCSRCHDTDPNCNVCHDRPEEEPKELLEEEEPETLPGNPLEEEIDRLLNENPETE